MMLLICTVCGSGVVEWGVGSEGGVEVINNNWLNQPPHSTTDSIYTYQFNYTLME